MKRWDIGCNTTAIPQRLNADIMDQNNTLGCITLASYFVINS